MKQVFRIDDEGFYIEPVILKDEEVTPVNCIEFFPPEGFYRPKWNGSSWEEGLSDNEIEEIKNRPAPSDPLTELGEQLAQEKLKNMQLNSQVSNLGQQLALMKLDVMKIKGGQPT